MFAWGRRQDAARGCSRLSEAWQQGPALTRQFVLTCAAGSLGSLTVWCGGKVSGGRAPRARRGADTHSRVPCWRRMGSSQAPCFPPRPHRVKSCSNIEYASCKSSPTYNLSPPHRFREWCVVVCAVSPGWGAHRFFNVQSSTQYRITLSPQPFPCSRIGATRNGSRSTHTMKTIDTVWLRSVLGCLRYMDLCSALFGAGSGLLMDPVPLSSPAQASVKENRKCSTSVQTRIP
jgi:hypothetical protein